MAGSLPRDVASAVRAIRDGTVTATELVGACLARIRACEPLVNAFTNVDEESALEHAATIDALHERGVSARPLQRIPVAVKDNIATARLPTTLGSSICRDWQVGYDATLVRKLEAAGAIIVGKNNLHEMALGATNINPHFGDVHNPWDAGRIAGGSSGGSAAAVAAGEVYASFGSDSGGSIRIPAAMCGIVGLKPTHGRISLHGLVGPAWSIDHLGPMARTVEDAAMLYEAVAGWDEQDPNTVRRPVDAVVPHLDDDTTRLRIGVIRDGSMGWVHSDVQSALERAADALEHSGVSVDSASLPGVEDGLYAAVAITVPTS